MGRKDPVGGTVEKIPETRQAEKGAAEMTGEGRELENKKGGDAP